MSDVDKKVDSLMTILKENGYKYTDKRRLMIQVLVEEDRYINAKYISEILWKDYPGLSFDTIYRNLSTYVDLGILEMTEINGERFFKVSCIDTDHHHHHHICLKCGKAKIIHIDLCSKLDIEELKGYKVDSHKFEIYGLCPNCLKEEKENV
ncbi:transcriptional repressor [Gemella sp. GH3]|uniref:Fur family transcriptional regulator n=1 Tax=unclassified Gemella TaxID=2624949 RepID=UPI0015D01554|nr:MULTISPECIES: Fur family transcriptional regulator [unclassified Gemella]MBF0713874.1 transcriptional repressor [Gemella sp. GH3.1]NYS50826.1 transcriptional repressor [Gemella sp. GH3]